MKKTTKSTATPAAIATKFKKTVDSANVIALAHMQASLDEINAIRKRDSNILADIEACGTKFAVMMVDDINAIAVVRKVSAPDEYQAVRFHPKLGVTGVWCRSTAVWSSLHLAYMDGVAELLLGRNSQFALFASRMLHD